MKKISLPPVGVIGFGNMGEAVVAGLLKTSPSTKVTTFELQQDAKAKALMQYKLTVHVTLAELVKASEILVIAIKPQDIPALLDDLKPLLKKHRVVSVAAGLKTSFFQNRLEIKNVVRFMPNLAAKVGRALVGVTPGEGADESFVNQALAIASAIGDPALIPEKLMAAITGVSGSGIAYVFHFIHALAMGALREGFPYPKALEHALTTVEGAVALLKSTGEHPIAFESKVCSPAGTTIEGVRILEASDFTSSVMDAVSAASRRAGELEG